jgi:phage I-like protein
VWNDYGREALRNRQYKYVSPAFSYDKSKATKDVLGEILSLSSVGLVNQPNLDLMALNASNKEDKLMNPEQLKALGLPADATAEQIASRIDEFDKAAKAAKAAKAVPQPTIDVNSILEQVGEKIAQAIKPLVDKFQAQDADSHTIAVNATLDKYVAAGKVTPGQRKFYEDRCKDAATLDEVKAHLDASPVLVSTNAKLQGAPDKNTGLSESDKAICKLMDIDPEDFAKTTPNLYGEAN